MAFEKPRAQYEHIAPAGLGGSRNVDQGVYRSVVACHGNETLRSAPRSSSVAASNASSVRLVLALDAIDQKRTLFPGRPAPFKDMVVDHYCVRPYRSAGISSRLDRRPAGAA